MLSKAAAAAGSRPDRSGSSPGTGAQSQLLPLLLPPAGTAASISLGGWCGALSVATARPLHTPWGSVARRGCEVCSVRLKGTGPKGRAPYQHHSRCRQARTPSWRTYLQGPAAARCLERRHRLHSAAVQLHSQDDGLAAPLAGDEQGVGVGSIHKALLWQCECVEPGECARSDGARHHGHDALRLAAGAGVGAGRLQQQEGRQQESHTERHVTLCFEASILSTKQQTTTTAHSRCRPPSRACTALTWRRARRCPPLPAGR
jgi:hypothetical protein